MTAIDAATYENAGLATIQIGCTKEELAATMAIAVAPSLVEIALATLETGTGEIDNLIGHARGTVTVYEELLAIVGEPFCATCFGHTVVSP